MTEHKSLPRIRNQKQAPLCYAAAICGVTEYLLSKQGQNVYLDDIKLHDEVQKMMAGRQGNQTRKALEYVEKSGIPIKGSNKRIYIKKVKYISPNDIFGFYEPLVIGCDLEAGESLTKRLTKDNYIGPRQEGYHEMVYMNSFGPYNSRIRIANSWGEKWGDKGYCYAKRTTVATSKKRFIMEAFQIIL